MLDLDSKTLIERVYETILSSKKISKIVVATSVDESDDILAEKLNSMNIEAFRGSLNNVLERFYMCAKSYKAQHIIRANADSPFLDSSLIDRLIDIYEQNICDYAAFSNTVYGLTTEIFSYQVLQEAFINTDDLYDIEHVTPYIKKHTKVYRPKIEHKYQRPEIRAVVDTLEDYINMQKFFFFCKYNQLEPNIDNYIVFFDKKDLF